MRQKKDVIDEIYRLFPLPKKELMPTISYTRLMRYKKNDLEYILHLFEVYMYLEK